MEEIGFQEKPKEVLSDLVEKHTESIIDQPRYLAELIRERCAFYDLEIRVLLAAMEEGIPSVLKRHKSEGGQPDGLLGQLSADLQANRGLSDKAARWAVMAWAEALKVPLKSQAADAAMPVRDSRPSPGWKIAVAVLSALLVIAIAAAVFFYHLNEEKKQTAIDPRRPIGAVQAPTQKAGEKDRKIEELTADRDRHKLFAQQWKADAERYMNLNDESQKKILQLNRELDEHPARIEELNSQLFFQRGEAARSKRLLQELQARPSPANQNQQVEQTRPAPAAAVQPPPQPPPPAAPRPAPDTEALKRSAEALVQAYYQSLKKQDVAAAIGMRQNPNIRRLEDEIRKIEDVQVHRVDAKPDTLSPDSVQVELDVSVKGKGPGQWERYAGDIELIRVENEWKIRSMANLRKVP